MIGDSGGISLTFLFMLVDFQEFSNIPQTLNQQFMKEFFSFGGLGMPGVCSKGYVGVLLGDYILVSSF